MKNDKLFFVSYLKDFMIFNRVGEKAQYNVFRDWVFANMEMLWNILGTKYVINYNYQ